MLRKKMGRLLRVFTPFTILLVGFLIMNYKIEESNVFQKPPATAAPEFIEQPAESVTTTPLPAAKGDPEPVATAIANAIELPTIAPEAAPELTPTLLPNDSVTLTGPPAESRFPLSATLTFYWFSDKQLSEGESFELYLADDASERLVGSVSEPNMGIAYQVNFIPESFDFSPGDYYWKVKLKQHDGDRILGESDRRSITLLESAK